ncbi:unnamed protein product [Macrosiphum euphorbiae]|uniref:CUB domain-containing protein n=1 Tax=Macrosiphum euphorbiae TaxID=13131 RepID=A0AAV0VNA7_9HEMI|nr:unnamed protein product [Macrosiphum euphorbiae]
MPYTTTPPSHPHAWAAASSPPTFYPHPNRSRCRYDVVVVGRVQQEGSSPLVLNLRNANVPDQGLLTIALPSFPTAIIYVMSKWVLFVIRAKKK